MKKLTFLLGTLGGAMAGYVFSNKRLRAELSEAKDATEAAQILGKHLSHDGQSVAKEVRELAQEHGLDDRLEEGKQYVQDYYSSAKDEVQKYLGAKVKEAKQVVTRATKKTKSKAKAKSR